MIFNFDDNCSFGRLGSLAFEGVGTILLRGGTMLGNISLHIQTSLKGATNTHKAAEKSKIYSNPKQFRKSFLWRQRPREGNSGMNLVILKGSGNVEQE